MGINFKTKEYLTNRNSLRYLITNPFQEPFSYTLIKALKEKNIVIENKKETCNKYTTELTFTLKKAKCCIPVNGKIFISKDHLISLKLQSGHEIKELKTREVSTAIQAILDLFKDV